MQCMRRFESCCHRLILFVNNIMIVISSYFTDIERYFKKYGVLFSLLVIYQGLFGGFVLSNKPKRLIKASQHIAFKLLTLLAISFTATKDIETSILAILLFIIIVHMLRTPDEKQKTNFGNFI